MAIVEINGMRCLVITICVLVLNASGLGVKDEPTAIAAGKVNFPVFRNLVT